MGAKARTMKTDTAILIMGCLPGRIHVGDVIMREYSQDVNTLYSANKSALTAAPGR